MIKRGSFTIETACVMPLILFTLMGILYLFFFVHNRAWLTAAAYESAVSGSMEGIKKDGPVYETARIKSQALGSLGFSERKIFPHKQRQEKRLLSHMILIQ